ncbi:MAG: TCP-1/cpn60 chaperonin family protein [Candidatus Thermoplasmatota archaeon]|nr:TCP-1/cpn60 chaperonin family protein [Candidatus Thermoplasmatota archaeon]
MGTTPILVLKEGTRRDRGRSAQTSNIAAAKAIADAVRSTLGPRGMDKMLVDGMGDVVITNDGVTILKEIDVEHPAAKMLVEVAKTQDQEVGDGTTTAVILAGEILKRAEDMVEQKIHPTVIAQGYRMAAEKATELLEELAEKVGPKDKDTLGKIAATSMISKAISANREQFADLAVKAVLRVAEEVAGAWQVDEDNIQIVKKQGGAVTDSEMVDGIIVDKERVHTAMPTRLEKAKVALVNAALEVKKTEFDARIQISNPEQLQAFLGEEENIIRGFVDALKGVGATVVFGQKGIDDMAQHFLAKEGIYTIRRVKKSDMEKLTKATGGRLVTKIQAISSADLGTAELVEERKIGNDDMTFVTGCKEAKAVSILLRGGTEHVVDELERSLDDALNVVRAAVEDGKMLTGGGSVHIELSLALRDYAPSVGGREQMAIEAFASAFEVVPRTLAENAGLDPIDTLLELRTAHTKGRKHHGIDLESGKVLDMRKLDVLEPMRVTKQAVASATDTAVMILRIDDVIASKGFKAGEGEAGEGGPEGEFD